MARLRYNGLSTTLGGSGLASGATTSVTFAAALTYNGGTAVPTIVSPDYIPLSILDSTGKLAEIVYLTAYTSGATTGTITRAQEGTSGAARASGLKVVQAPTTLDGASFRGAKAVAASQNIASGSAVALALTTEEYDTDGIHDNVTNNTRFTVPAGMAGVWRFIATVNYASSGVSATRGLFFFVNGANVQENGGVRVNGLTSLAMPLSSAVDLALSVGDYVELAGFQSTGGVLATTGKLSCQYLGAL